MDGLGQLDELVFAKVGVLQAGEQPGQGVVVALGVEGGQALHKFFVGQSGVQAVAAAQFALELLVVVGLDGLAVAGAAVQVGDGGDVFQRGAAQQLAAQGHGAAEAPAAQGETQEDDGCGVE